MAKQQSIQKLSAKELSFPNDNRAQMVAPPAGAQAADILRALAIQKPKALILVFGGAKGLDETAKNRLEQLFSRGIARAAARASALIIDGGTQSGVMAMMGQGVADRGGKSVLVGVAPAGKVSYPEGPAEGSIEDGAPLDPNHSHFVLVDSDEWGGETEMMFELAEGLAEQVPVIALLVNGGAISRDEVLRSVRHGWPIVIIEGSGRLADEIAKQREQPPSYIDEPVMAEINADGDIHLLPIDSAMNQVEELIARLLASDQTLYLAWERFAAYDESANKQKKGFNRTQKWILFLGVLGTLLALTQATLRTLQLVESLNWLDPFLHWVIVIVPITISILLAASNRFKVGNKWILLRASAEALKGEIYRYRARGEIYSDQETASTSREAKLARKVGSISRGLMQTDVNISSVHTYEGPIPPRMYGAEETDDGFSFLTPDRYLEIRLGEQVNFLQGRTVQLERLLKRLEWLAYIAGGAGTLLAAIGLELWIALTSALIVAFGTYLEYQQVENTLMRYNQARTDLANVRGWWLALPAVEQKDPKNVDKLVGLTEKILRREQAGWVQEMDDTLAELRAEQTSDSGGEA